MSSASPARKKSRKESGTATSSDASDTPSCFLDTFPKVINNNVLRHFSSLPNSKDWLPSIPLESIIELYGVRGELGTFMKDIRFETLCISQSFKGAGEITHLNWKERKGPLLWTDDIEVARRFVLAGGGQHLLTVMVGLCMIKEGSGIEIVDDFYRSCPNVRSLSIGDPTEGWLSRFKEQLEQLKIVPETSTGISRCTNLIELKVSMVSYEFDWGDLLKPIGSRLESLTLDFGQIGTDERIQEVSVAFGEIKTHCRNLRRISIYSCYGTKVLNKGISPLLASYADQLEFCYVKDMMKRQLTTIARACKNARFSAQVYHSSGLYRTVKVLGHQLENIHIWWEEGSRIRNFDDLTNAWNECANLRELQLENCSIENVKAITAKPKEHVKVLYITPGYRLKEEKEVKEMMDLFSEAIVGVEIFNYSGREFSPNVFEKFITRNKSSLCVIYFYFMGVNRNEMDIFLPLFLECPHLEDVHGKFSQNMVKTLERRGVRCHDYDGP